MVDKNTGRMSFTPSSGVRTNVYLTPQPLLERVYACLGEVDLDPCSNSVAEPQVKAKRYFVEGNNGLLYPWVGRIFANPPYKTVKKWSQKFLQEYWSGHMSEGILLVAASQETGWYKDVIESGALVCAIHGRLHFDTAPGVPCKEQSRFPSSLFYLGHRQREFIQEFKGVGPIMQKVKYD